MIAVPASPVPASTGWAERLADRSESVQRSRARQIEQAQAIVAAARRLITVQGDQFTTQELVKEAGVALQTFYRIFESKDRLLLAVFEDLIAESCVDYERAAQALPDPIARLHFTDLVSRQLVAAADEGLLASSDPERDAWYVTKLVMAVFHHYAYAGSDADPTAIGEQLWEFCLRGLGGRAP